MPLMITRNQLILIGVAAVLLLIVVAAGARGCSGGCTSPFGGTTIIAGGIDAGPGEAIIAQRLDASLQAGETHIEQIELKFNEDLAAFDAQQRAEYDRLRGGDDLEAAARMLSSWNRARRDAGR